MHKQACSGYKHILRETKVSFVLAHASQFISSDVRVLGCKAIKQKMLR